MNQESENYFANRIKNNTFESPNETDMAKIETFDEFVGDDGELTDLSCTFDDKNPKQLIFQMGSVTIEVLGGVAQRRGNLEATLKVMDKDAPGRVMRDTVNLYKRGSVVGFIEQCSDLLLTDIGVLDTALSWLTGSLESYLERKEQSTTKAIDEPRELTPEREKKALTALKSKRLYSSLCKNLSSIGIEGEDKAVQLLYFSMTSRLLDTPLNVIIHAASGSGKSAMIETVAGCMPQGSYIEITSLSSKSFYHWHTDFLRNKLIILEDWQTLDGETEYMLREIQSKGKISRVVTMRDKNNVLQTVLKEVHGPVSVIAASTKPSVYEDNAGRSLELFLTSDKKKDEQILKRQQLLAEQSDTFAKEAATRETLRDMQMMLKPFRVIIPFATKLSLPDGLFQPRRVMPMYINLIRSVALVHQYQREIKAATDGGHDFLIATDMDVEIASDLFAEVLASKGDMLPTTNRDFLSRLSEHLQANKLECFSAKDIIIGMHMHPSKVKRNLKTLQEFGYLEITSGDRYKKGYTYRITDSGSYEKLISRIKETMQKNTDRVREKE